MGTPEEMKTKCMKNDVLEIQGTGVESWVEKLQSVSCVQDVALFGSGVHVVVDQAAVVIPRIEELFNAERAAGFTVRKIMPSLEDVFVSLIETYDKAKSDDRSVGA